MDAMTLSSDLAPVVVTGRLVLRPFALADVAEYQAICADPEVMAHLGGVWSPAWTEEVMASANASLSDDGYGMVAVERRADGAFVGAAGLSVEEWFPDDLQVGWRLAPRHWGHGYATEAGGAWLEHGFAVLGRERILAMADVPNHRSTAVMERLGMTRDHVGRFEEHGTEFDAVVYVMTADAWRDGASRQTGEPGTKAEHDDPRNG